MSGHDYDLDVLRERWRREKHALRLRDVNADGFGAGGLGERLDDPSVRLVVLPADPEDARVEFDDDLLEWWGQDWIDPASGEKTSWGRTTLTAAAMIRYTESGEGSWSRYLALRRDGGIDLGMGTDSARGVSEQRHFWLVTIVGRIWSAMSVYRECLARLSPPGPWEVTLALVNTADAHLSGVAEGWSDPLQGGYGLKPNREAGLLHSRLVPEWPDELGCQGLAFGLGTVIDNGWGVVQRRFIARTGQNADKFDGSKYCW